MLKQCPWCQQVDLSSDTAPQEQLGPVIPPSGFDLVYSHLTFHHLPSKCILSDFLIQIKVIHSCIPICAGMEQVLHAVLRVVKPGGIVAVSDFEAHEYSKEFHPSAMHAEVARHGIVPGELAEGMKNAGFQNVTVHRPFTFPKEVESGGKKDFQFLLILAEK